MKALCCLVLLPWLLANLGLEQPVGPRRFTVIPNIQDADPSIRSPMRVRIPTRLKVVHTNDTLAIRIDTNSLKVVQTTAGARMILGVRYVLFVHPEGKERGHRDSVGLLCDPDLDFNFGSTTHLVQVHEQLGGNVVVEMDLELFETDVPVQHMWSPTSEKFKVLRKGTLKELIR